MKGRRSWGCDEADGKGRRDTTIRQGSLHGCLREHGSAWFAWISPEDVKLRWRPVCWRETAMQLSFERYSHLRLFSMRISLCILGVPAGAFGGRGQRDSATFMTDEPKRSATR